MSEEEFVASEEELQKLLAKAQTLSEALPFIREFHGETVVVKYGGHAMTDDDMKRMVIEDIILLDLIGIRPVIVHGGGPEITAMMDRLGLKPHFVDGMRVTDAEAMEIVEMVLGKIRGELVAMINRHGGRAVGLSGKDGGLLRCKRLFHCGVEGKMADIGFVGEVTEVNPELISVLDAHDFIPVISPVAVDANGQTYNVNADLAAAELARKLKARKFILLTDVRGVLRDPSDPTSLITSLAMDKVQGLIEQKIISGGMIPKVQACMRALDQGVEKSHILDGRLPHALLLELLTASGVGTQILAHKTS
ncbi:MAG: Acetylglutamate kinase [candidate division BRC1 bacterium ADurb.BinA364]|nr:MAG: Acetylglutamate kinase [candidate division BRC1 bacterium ADurb.BinA364]